MASQTPRQKRITGRVMHELKHGELKGGRNGKGGKVKSRRQAIAIALEEAGASRYESGFRNRRNLRRTEKKEAQGRTGQQEREGKSHVGAYAIATLGWKRSIQFVDNGQFIRLRHPEGNPVNLFSCERLVRPQKIHVLFMVCKSEEDNTFRAVNAILHLNQGSFIFNLFGVRFYFAGQRHVVRGVMFRNPKWHTLNASD